MVVLRGEVASYEQGTPFHSPISFALGFVTSPRETTGSEPWAGGNTWRKTEVEPWMRWIRSTASASCHRRGNDLNGFGTKNGSSRGQNLALTGVFVPRSLNSGSHSAGVLPAECTSCLCALSVTPSDEVDQVDGPRVLPPEGVN